MRAPHLREPSESLPAPPLSPAPLPPSSPPRRTRLAPPPHPPTHPHPHTPPRPHDRDSPLAAHIPRARRETAAPRAWRGLPCRSISTDVLQTGGFDQLASPVPFCALALVIVTAIWSTFYLNKAMMHFKNSEVATARTLGGLRADPRKGGGSKRGGGGGGGWARGHLVLASLGGACLLHHLHPGFDRRRCAGLPVPRSPPLAAAPRPRLSRSPTRALAPPAASSSASLRAPQSFSRRVASARSSASKLVATTWRAHDTSLTRP